jgi:hypothetical protein
MQTPDLKGKCYKRCQAAQIQQSPLAKEVSPMVAHLIYGVRMRHALFATILWAPLHFCQNVVL